MVEGKADGQMFERNNTYVCGPLGISFFYTAPLYPEGNMPL